MVIGREVCLGFAVRAELEPIDLRLANAQLVYCGGRTGRERREGVGREDDCAGRVGVDRRAAASKNVARHPDFGHKVPCLGVSVDEAHEIFGMVRAICEEFS